MEAHTRDGSPSKALAERVVIIGGPCTGKTTYAKRFEAVRHTDDLKKLPWSEVSEHVARWFSLPGPWCIEGVRAVHALRKWLERHPGKPCDLVVHCVVPREQLTAKQRGMYLGCQAIWNEIAPELAARGVKIIVA